MKKAVLFSILTALCILASAQAPESFNYQVVVRDGSTNSPLTNQNVSFRMSILKGSSSGESKYSELHSANTGALGIVNLVIGNGTDKAGTISAIDWGADTYYLKVEIDKTGGSTYVDMGTIQLLSVPYAMYAKSASTAFDAVKITGDQSIAGIKTFTGTINAGNHAIANVADPVANQDAANKAYVDVLLEKIQNLEYLAGLQEPVTDIHGNVYRTIRIGSQVWMAENLKVTKFSNGNNIPTTTADLSGVSTPIYQWAYDGNESNVAIYGRLYTSYAVTDPRNICPTGWHIPSGSEWLVLLDDYLSGSDVAGGKLKEIGTTHWLSPNKAATDEIGFTALPGGRRGTVGTFDELGEKGYFWSSNWDPSGTGALMPLIYGSGIASTPNNYIRKMGCSVRCVKD